MPYRLTRIAVFTLAGLSSLMTAPAIAQGYPERPIRVIVPVGPGGGFDMLGRTVAPGLAERLGQPVVVENRPGAGSLVGTEAVAKAPHDGYTLLVGGVSNLAINAGLYKSLPYDPVADFRALSVSISNSLCLAGRKDLPQSTFKELMDFARANPDKVNYGSAGVGTAQHLVGALLARAASASLVHIPFKGAGPAQQELLGGRLDMLWNTCSALKPAIDAGQVKGLATSGRERTPGLAALPTIIESGVARFEFDSWVGFFAGIRTPQPIVERLRREITAVITAPEYVARMERDGGRVWRLTGPETDAFVRAEAERWKAQVTQAGITAE
jgi:tripartite-type tricarboxylate transporter receptor subunit TctC